MKSKTLTKKLTVCLLASCMTFTLAPISSFRVEAADNGMSKKLNGLSMPEESNKESETENPYSSFIPNYSSFANIINNTTTINDNDTTTINNNSNNNFYNNSNTTVNINSNSNNTNNTTINQDSFNNDTTTNIITTNTNIDSNNSDTTNTNIDSNNSYSTVNSIDNTLNLSGTWEPGRNSSEWRMKKTDGSYAASQWGLVDGYWYLFGNEGYTCSGWQQVDGNWYFFGDNAAMQTGWVNSANRWYYLMSDGRMLANTTTPDGYEVNENGEWTVNGVVQTNR